MNVPAIFYARMTSTIGYQSTSRCRQFENLRVDHLVETFIAFYGIRTLPWQLEHISNFILVHMHLVVLTPYFTS